MQATSTVPEFVISTAVRTYCEDRGMFDYLRVALRLASEVFQFDVGPRVTVETDPETDEQSVVIDISSQMSCDEALERKRQYTEQWVRSVPPDVIGTIRLILDIA